MGWVMYVVVHGGGGGVVYGCAWDEVRNMIVCGGGLDT